MGCELDFRTVSTTYGQTIINNVQDPNLLRPFQNKINLGISHELMKGVSVSFEWFRTTNGNTQQTWNITRMQACGGLTPAAGMSVADMTSLVTCNQGLSTAQIAANPQFQLITAFSPIDGHAVPIYDTISTAVSALAANNFVTTDNDQTAVYNGFDVGFNARLPKGGRMFGGTTTEKTTGSNCDTAIQNPNSLLFCDSANLGGGYSIPWKTQFKLAATFPLPWFGLVLNGSYQALPGYNETQTGYSVTKATRYTSCPGTSAAAGCVAISPTSTSTLVAPTEIATTLTAQLAPSGVNLTPRNNQVDFGISKRLKFGRIRIDPKVDMFNALNSDDYYSVTSTTFSPVLDPSLPVATALTSPATPSLTNGFTTFHQPSRFLQGRIFRLGANITW